MGMRNSPLTIMSIAVSHNRIAFVFLIDRQPMDWEMSFVAAASPKSAASKVAQWIKHYGVDVVITEDTRISTRKGRRTQSLLEAVCAAVQVTDTQHIEVVRSQPFQSKYEQIDDLITRYPQMKAVAPRKRKYWENEPHSVTIFEALAMAEQVTCT